MKIVVVNDAAELAQSIADRIEQLLTEKPDAVLGLATGSSPLAVYEELTRRYEAGRLSFARARAFTLDEYVGLPQDHPESYRTVIGRDFVNRVNFAADAVTCPDGNAPDVAAAAAAYDRAITEAGGIDFQILGVGSNGHIAFNEPGSTTDSRTRVIELTEQTRIDNSRFFNNEPATVPTHAVSQGLGTMLEARELAMIALGEGKAKAVRALADGASSIEWPVACLAQHENTSVYVDAAAASLLDRESILR